MRKENRFLHIREISKLLSEYEPDQNPEVFSANKLTPTISNLKTAGKIVKLQIGTSNQNCFWGSPSWLSPDGNSLPEFKPNENLIKKDDISI